MTEESRVEERSIVPAPSAAANGFIREHHDLSKAKQASLLGTGGYSCYENKSKLRSVGHKDLGKLCCFYGDSKVCRDHEAGCTKARDSVTLVG